VVGGSASWKSRVPTTGHRRPFTNAESKRARVGVQAMKREPIPKKLRFAVFERDGFRCRYCGQSGENTILHADHDIPVSQGGPTTMENLVTSCAACNLGKGSNRAYALPHQRELASMCIFFDTAVRLFGSDVSINWINVWYFLRRVNLRKGIDHPMVYELLTESTSWIDAKRAILKHLKGEEKHPHVRLVVDNDYVI
jgi:hypothetical protein